jgi:hypothetical protein
MGPENMVTPCTTGNSCCAQQPCLFCRFLRLHRKVDAQPQRSVFDNRTNTGSVLDLSGKRLPAQPVDATPSNVLIRQCFPGRTDLFGCTRSKPSQGSVPADLTLASDLTFVFNASRVRPECCVDPLKPPLLIGHVVHHEGRFSWTTSKRVDWRAIAQQLGVCIETLYRIVPGRSKTREKVSGTQ